MQCRSKNAPRCSARGSVRASARRSGASSMFRGAANGFDNEVNVGPDTSNFGYFGYAEMPEMQCQRVRNAEMQCRNAVPEGPAGRIAVLAALVMASGRRIPVGRRGRAGPSPWPSFGDRWGRGRGPWSGRRWSRGGKIAAVFAVSCRNEGRQPCHRFPSSLALTAF